MCQSGSCDFAPWMTPSLPGRAVTWTKKGIQIFMDALEDRAVPVDGPLQHRAAEERLDGARQLPRVAILELAGGDRLVEQLGDFRTHCVGMRKCVLVKLRVDEIHLQEREAVRERFGR